MDRLRVVEDNAPYHGGEFNFHVNTTYKIKKLWLPANSPDLNTIENIWYTLKTRLHKQFTNTERRPHSANELWEVMQEEWEAIDQEVFDNLVDSMPECIEAVISAERGHTKW